MDVVDCRIRLDAAAGELCVTEFGSRVTGADEWMSKFKIKVARIEAAAGTRAVCITFHIDRGAVSFQVPIHLGALRQTSTTIPKWFEPPEVRCIVPS